jgi:hypothetical protein
VKDLGCQFHILLHIAVPVSGVKYIDGLLGDHVVHGLKLQLSIFQSH